MKGGLIFVAGLLVGMAGGMMFGRFGGGEERSEEARDAERGGALTRTDPSTGGADGMGARTGRRSAKGPGGRSSIRTPAQAQELLEYLSALGRVDDFEELNFMELVRHAHLVTVMSESEVTALLRGIGADEEDRESGELRQVFQALLFARLAEMDGPGAMRMALSGELGEEWEGDEDDLVAIGLSSWVGADPERASKWFLSEGLSDPRFMEVLDDNEVQQAFFAAMARHDSKMALALVEEVGEDVASEGMEVIARYEKTVEGLENLLARTSEISRGEVFEELASRDPAAAARWLAAQERGGLKDRDEYVQTVAQEMMQDERDEGVAWYMNQELSEEGQATRLKQIVSQLAEDPVSAATWLADQPDTPVRDPAEAQMARHMVANEGRNWEEGFRWVTRVGGAEQRNETVNWILRRAWNRREGTMDSAAEEAAREAGFGAEVDAYIEEHGRGE